MRTQADARPAHALHPNGQDVAGLPYRHTRRLHLGQQQDNTGGQTATAFRRGSYGNVNLLYYPAKNVLTGLEFVWGELEQKSGASAVDYRLQFSTKVTF